MRKNVRQECIDALREAKRPLTALEVKHAINHNNVTSVIQSLHRAKGCYITAWTQGPMGRTAALWAYDPMGVRQNVTFTKKVKA